MRIKKLVLIMIVCFCFYGCSLAGGQKIEETLDLPAITIHVVGNGEEIRDLSENLSSSGFQKGLEIWVLGYYTYEKELVINPRILGHEITHVLEEYYAHIKNPDDGEKHHIVWR